MVVRFKYLQPYCKQHGISIKDYYVIENEPVIFRVSDKKALHYCIYKEEKMFFNLSKNSYTPIFDALEWCEENEIDPLNMSDEDKMAFKLKFL